MPFALGTPIDGAVRYAVRPPTRIRSGRTRVASSPSAILSPDKSRVDDAEARRLESTDAFAELKQLSEKQSVNRAQDVSSRNVARRLQKIA